MPEAEQTVLTMDGENEREGAWWMAAKGSLARRLHLAFDELKGGKREGGERPGDGATCCEDRQGKGG